MSSSSSADAVLRAAVPQGRVIRVIDSHTGGEPTRVVIAGGPDLPDGSVAQKLARLRAEHDDLRRLCIHEPRGHDVLVGALLCKPAELASAAGVIFFNNIGYLGMCGHGTIGLVITLAHLGRIDPGTIRIETSVGPVEATWHGGARVSLTNVASQRIAKDVRVEVPGIGAVCGDVAWAGNGFYLVKEHGETLQRENVQRLSEVAKAIRAAVNAAGYGQVDHVELFGPPTADSADSRNFVLCPGGAYDRSACGTGTSAKLACLAADGMLDEDAPWVQESIIGSAFEGSFRWLDRQRGTIIPTITGTAHITAEANLIVGPDDPFPVGLGI